MIVMIESDSQRVYIHTGNEIVNTKEDGVDEMEQVITFSHYLVVWFWRRII